MASPQTVKRAILRSLQQCGSYLLPEDSLFDQVSLSLPMLTPTEFRASLKELEILRAVLSVKSELDVKPRYKLTLEGKALIEENA